MLKGKQFAVIGEAMLELSHQDDTSLLLSFAGDTLNFAIYLRRLLKVQPFHVHYVTALGEDFYSDRMLINWKKEGIMTDLVRRFKGKLPGLYLIRTSETGEREFYFYRSASAARELLKGGEEADHLLQHLVTMDYLYLSGITLAILDDEGRDRLWNILKQAKQRDTLIFFDTNYRSSLWSDSVLARAAIEKTLEFVHTAFPTFIDEQVLFGDLTPRDCAQRLLKSGITEVVVKCGSEPALVVDKNGENSVPACLVDNVIDTTGAGDSFNAAYLAARLSGRPPFEAAQWGHRLAARVITQLGAIIPLTTMPTLL